MFMESWNTLSSQLALYMEEYACDDEGAEQEYDLIAKKLTDLLPHINKAAKGKITYTNLQVYQTIIQDLLSVQRQITSDNATSTLDSFHEL